MKDLADLLEKTSRTFALTIPLLPEPTRHEVSVAYLLFRIIDTFEDATRWSATKRVEALDEFRRLLEDPDPSKAQALADRCRDDPPLDQAGYLELLEAIPFTFDCYERLRPASRELVKAHVCRTASGMAAFVSRMDPAGGLELQSIAELCDYCYVVAGIVGEMLTELFLLEWPDLCGIASRLRARARSFGEGLQLVNILKDARPDAREGRIYLPAGAKTGEVFTLAHGDLDAAVEYVTALQEAGAPPGLVMFTALPVRLAIDTLAVVREQGSGAKLARARVFEITAQVAYDADAGRSPFAPSSSSREEAPAAL